MKADVDAFTTLGWGLRRYAWLVALFMVALGVLVPTLLDRVPDRYDAQAQVGPSGPLRLANIDILPRMGESVFNNGAVASEVRQSFDPPLPRSESVIPERVELVAAQDNVVLGVVGHGPTPQAASRVANISASRFAQELNNYTSSVGPFTVQRLADTPTRPVPTVGGALAIGIGVLSGLIAGVGAVALLLVWRQPVIDAKSAEDATGTPVVTQLQLTGRGDSLGLPRLCRELLSAHVDMLFLAGPRRTRRARRQLTAELSSVLGWVRNVESADRSRQRSEVYQQPGQQDLVIIDDPSPLEAATRPDSSLLLLVVREGISHTALRRQAAHHLDGGATGLVLMRRSRWRPGRHLRRSRPHQRQSEDVQSRPRASHHEPANLPTAD